MCPRTLVDRKRKRYDNAVDVVVRLHDPTDQVPNARQLRDLHMFSSVTSLVLLICNTPDVTCHICNSDSCHFRLKVMRFPLWLAFCLRFALCSCHAFHIMSSCASRLHLCSSHASGLFPSCPFRNPTLPHAPVAPLLSRFVSGRKTFSEWADIFQLDLVYHR